MIRLRINWSGPASGYSIWHFDSDLSGAQDAADAALVFLNELDTFLSPQMQARVDNEVQQIDPATGQITGVETVSTIGVTGQASGKMLPQSTCLLIRWRTGAFVGGREQRGRTFIPGFTDANNDTDGEPLAGLISGIASRAQTLADTSTLCIWSPTNQGFATVTTAQVWDEWAVMRSRRE